MQEINRTHCIRFFPGHPFQYYALFLSKCTLHLLHFSLLQDNRVHIGPKMEIRVVTLGLDGAGKTTILFKLKQDEFMQPIPTIGKYHRFVNTKLLN